MLYIKRVVNVDDYDELYQLKSQKDAVRWSGFETKPDYDKFKSYFIEKVINNPNTYLFFLLDTEVPEEKCMGYEQFDYDEITKIVQMRGTVLKRKYQGFGLYDEFRVLIEARIREMGGAKIESWVSEKNIASYYNADNMGWVKTDEYEIKNLPLLGGEHKFYKWIKEL